MGHKKRTAAIIGATVAVLALVGCSSALRLAYADWASPAAKAPAIAKVAAAVPAPVMTPVASPVVTPPPPPPPDASVCATTPAGVKHLYVSISQQHFWACTGPVLLTDAAVTTGASAITNVHDATPVGLFHITGKVAHTVLAGHDINGAWNDKVTYWMPFSGGDGFHDAPWQTFPLGSPLYTTQGSHGCIHLPLDALTTVFNWAAIGTPVTIQS